MEFVHKPVMLSEAVDALNIRPDGIYVDGTAGGGGHSAAILARLGSGRLYSIDRDPDAIAAVTKRFSGDPRSVILEGKFSDMQRLLHGQGAGLVDGILLDIGVSSHQLDTAERGFSFHKDAPLDMRMSQSGATAADLVNTLSKEELADIFYRYGEEKYSRSIAAAIEKRRREKPIETTLELAELIKESVPQKARREGHPARRCFQALRIAVNGELDELSSGLDAALSLLANGGRLAVISFHSLEDRMVKRRMAQWAQGCTCPKDFPVCVCGNKPKARLIGKAISPSRQELEENPRCSSARLRVCEKIL